MGENIGSSSRFSKIDSFVSANPGTPEMKKLLAIMRLNSLEASKKEKEIRNMVKKKVNYLKKILPMSKHIFFYLKK